MDFIFDHFEILAIIGIALASWLKARKAQKEEVEAEEEAEITAPDAAEPETVQPEPAEPETDTPRPKRRKRKISFV